MKSTAFFFSAQSSSTSFSISWRVWMSSARERLVHQDDVGVEHQRLRQAVRLRMPPESWCG